MLGSLSDLKTNIDDISNIINLIKSTFEQNNYVTTKFEPINYKTQIVNGTNYFVKIETDNEIVHLRIHQELPHNNSVVTLHSQQLGKQRTEDILYF